MSVDLITRGASRRRVFVELGARMSSGEQQQNESNLHRTEKMKN